MLLVATLLRLALNVASTRVVLLHGHTGTDAAGKVIEAFGEFVVGGNYAVGLVVFAILVIINFVVVTKGAGRVSEVSARFTLDAMPGKQMAIDADLNAGLITQERPRARREDVGREADFYGSMDGASKFVRGDAVAGILILFINIIGGMASSGRCSMAWRSPMPAQLHAADHRRRTGGADSLAAAVVGHRRSSSPACPANRGHVQAGDRAVVRQPAWLLYVSGGVIGIMGLIRACPIWRSSRSPPSPAVRRTRSQQRSERETQEPVRQTPAETASLEPRDLTWDDVGPVDMIGLEVGYRLIPLVDRAQGGQMMGRIKGVRKKLSHELGLPDSAGAHPRQPGIGRQRLPHSADGRAGRRSRSPS